MVITATRRRKATSTIKKIEWVSFRGGAAVVFLAVPARVVVASLTNSDYRIKSWSSYVMRGPCIFKATHLESPAPCRPCTLQACTLQALHLQSDETKIRASLGGDP